jgi:hypothetical protein
MTMQQIPRQEWAAFFYAFSREHRGWLVTLEVFEAGKGGYVKARELPLADVAFDTEETADQITISLYDALEGHIDHRLSAPKQIRLDTGREGGGDRALEIETIVGETVILRFGAPVRARTLEGVPG